MSFNPANFPWTLANNEAIDSPETNEAAEAMHCAEELHAAAGRFEARGLGDQFARKSAMAARDIAAKLLRFGSFASDTQREYAAKLVEWSKPRPVFTAATPAERAPAAVEMPKLFDLMQRLAKLHIGKLTIARRNGDTLCWIKHEDCEKVIGKLEVGRVTLWQRPLIDSKAVMAALVEIEADPEAAAVLHGRASGRCSICNRDLTDPESIERGIGPICAGKF